MVKEISSDGQTQSPLGGDLDSEAVIGAAHRLLGNLQGPQTADEIEAAMSEREDPWQAIGGGDRRTDVLTNTKLTNLGQELAGRVAVLDMEAAGRDGGDIVKFKILRGLMTIAQMAAQGCSNIDEFLEIVSPSDSKVSQQRKEELMITYDSLELFRTAYLTRVEFFRNYKSVLWESAENTRATLDAVNQGVGIIAELTSPNRQSIEGFINKLQAGLLDKAGIPPLRRGMTPQEIRGRRTRIDNLSVAAWRDWGETPEGQHHVPLGEPAEIIDLFMRRENPAP